MEDADDADDDAGLGLVGARRPWSCRHGWRRTMYVDMTCRLEERRSQSLDSAPSRCPKSEQTKGQGIRRVELLRCCPDRGSAMDAGSGHKIYYVCVESC